VVRPPVCHAGGRGFEPHRRPYQRYHRDDEQRAAAKALLLKAEDGELEVALPQFVVFEIVYVLQSTYRIPFDQKLSKRAKDLGVASYW
jgi:predicted nucleic acid-binding protein